MYKPYYSFNKYLQNKFGCKVYKVTIDAGMTCPNRDGTKGVGGCIYCNNEGFSVNSRREIRPVREQVSEGIKFKKKRYNAEKFIAYFQAYSNTYAPVHRLDKLYHEGVDHPDVVGLAVGTRPDCISKEKIDLLQSFTDDYEVWVEYGLQTCHDRTLELINRKHNYSHFLEALDMTLGKNIKICAHIIFGLPGENHEDMMETIEKLSSLPVDGIKFHVLHIMRNTILEKAYIDGEIQLLEQDEYVNLVCDALEILSPDITIHRLTADAPPPALVAPEWCLNKGTLLNQIEGELKSRGTFQGCNCVASNTMK